MNDQLHNHFLKSYTAVQQSLFAYIRSTGFGLSDTEDILQDVAVALWECYDTYDPSRSFVGWALGVTRNVVLKQHRYNRVRKIMLVDSTVIGHISDKVAETLSTHEGQLREEKDQMESCIKELPASAQNILRLRYQKSFSLDKIAETVQKSYAAVGMLLMRIRMKLIQCVSASPTGGAS